MSDVHNLSLSSKVRAFQWGVVLAWRIDRGMLLLWSVLTIFLALLPAAILYYNRQVVAILSAYIAVGGQYNGLVLNIVMLGVVMTIWGVSARINDDLLYMLMYESYYLGLQEYIMDEVQCIEMTDLLKKDYIDHFFASIRRIGSLTDSMSSGCILLGKLVSAGSLTAVAFSISPVIAAAVVMYTVSVLFVIYKMSNKTRFTLQEYQELDRLADFFEKLPLQTDTAKELRVCANIEELKARWSEHYSQVEALSMKHVNGAPMIGFVSGILFYALMAVVIVWGIFGVWSGGIGPATLLMLYAMCVNLAAIVKSLPRSYFGFDYGLFGLDLQRRFFSVIPRIDADADVSKADTPLDEEVVFHAENLSFTYPSGEPVLCDLNLTVRRGETIALVGANGSGKTTLLMNLLGIIKPTSGTLRFMGRQYDDYKSGWITKQIGAFFQDFWLYHLPISQNVGVGDISKVDDEDAILTAMKKGGALGLIERLTKGLQTRLHRNIYKDGVELSGGEGQRVAVSRTHMSDRDILVFDEPASMLDPIAEMEQFFHIKNKLPGKTAILVSHRIGFARLAERIIVLKDGRIVEDGSHNELMSQNGTYAEFFNEQAQWYSNGGVK